MDVDKELNKFNDNIMRTIGNGYTLAEILVSLCTTPIFKLATKDGEIITDENGVPKIETNEDGINIINESGINEAIHEQMAKYQNVDKID